MKIKSTNLGVTCVSVVVVCAFVVAKPADAIPPFKKAFEQKYADVLQDENVKKTFRKANCNICHVKGKKKDVHNAYGEHLEDLIEGCAKDRLDAAKKIGDDEAKQETEKLVAELNEALAKVELMKRKDGQKYGEIIKSGALPEPSAMEGAADNSSESE